MYRIAVHAPGKNAYLRPLTGHDERALHVGPGAVNALVQRLLEKDDSSPGLTIGERDRALTALWGHTFGDTILATHRCVNCAELFDISFSLSQLVATLDAVLRPDEVAALNADGSATLRGGQTVRAPTAEAEAAVTGLGLEEAVAVLTERFVEGDDPVDAETLDRVLDWLSPVVDLDLDGVCPECDTAQGIRFSIEHFLMTTLQRERPRLHREIHLLATAYGWPLEDILGLDRDERQALVALVETDRGTRLGGWS